MEAAERLGLTGGGVAQKCVLDRVNGKGDPVDGRERGRRSGRGGGEGQEFTQLQAVSGELATQARTPSSLLSSSRPWLCEAACPCKVSV